MTEQRKCPAYLDQKQIVSVAKILQLIQKKQKASNCLEKEQVAAAHHLEPGGHTC